MGVTDRMSTEALTFAGGTRSIARGSELRRRKECSKSSKNLRCGEACSTWR